MSRTAQGMGLGGKDGEFACLDNILARIKQLSEAEKCMISEIITLCKLLLVNPATSAAGERSFSSAQRLKTWLRSMMTQTKFSSLTILKSDSLNEVPKESWKLIGNISLSVLCLWVLKCPGDTHPLRLLV